MNAVFWLLVVLVFIGLSFHFSITGRSSRGSLPKDFDFDLYKTRELSLRGLFDKTKWK